MGELNYRRSSAAEKAVDKDQESAIAKYKRRKRLSGFVLRASIKSGLKLPSQKTDLSNRALSSALRYKKSFATLRKNRNLDYKVRDLYEGNDELKKELDKYNAERDARKAYLKALPKNKAIQLYKKVSLAFPRSKAEKLTSSIASLKQFALIRRKALVVLAAALLPIGLVVTGLSKDDRVDKSGNTIVAGQLSDEKPDFDLLLPKGKSAEMLGGIKRISPQSSDPAFTFVDVIDSAGIKVTEQLQPKSFEGNIDVELEKVAKNFQATDIIQIDDLRVYHGINEKMGIQRVITAKGGLLILITSERKLTDDQWAAYIISLQ